MRRPKRTAQQREYEKAQRRLLTLKRAAGAFAFRETPSESPDGTRPFEGDPDVRECGLCHSVTCARCGATL